MKTYKDMVEEVNGTVSAREKLKKAKKGDTMSFTHHKHGEVSGQYHGTKRMGPHSYASVEVKGKGKFYVPLHQVTHHPKPKVNEASFDDVNAAIQAQHRADLAAKKKADNIAQTDRVNKQIQRTQSAVLKHIKDFSSKK